MKFDDKFNNLTEAYLKIPARRLMYPRGLSLSEEFVTAFNAECNRLVGEGQDSRKLCERVAKSLQFHFNISEDSPEEPSATRFELRQLHQDEVENVVAQVSEKGDVEVAEEDEDEVEEDKKPGG